MFTVEVNLALPEIITSPPRLTPLKKMVKNQKKVMGTGQVPPPPLRGEGGYDQWEPLSDLNLWSLLVKNQEDKTRQKN